MELLILLCPTTITAHIITFNLLSEVPREAEHSAGVGNPVGTPVGICPVGAPLHSPPTTPGN